MQKPYADTPILYNLMAGEIGADIALEVSLLISADKIPLPVKVTAWISNDGSLNITAATGPMTNYRYRLQMDSPGYHPRSASATEKYVSRLINDQIVAKAKDESIGGP